MGKKSLSLYQGCVAELIEKKSRFIVTVIPVTTSEEAVLELEKIRKKYWDARHNCFAYVLGEDGMEQRCSDDGEPSNTAGKPMLDVILGSEIKNILVVVTRYFGGTLLGTGGLVRAYSQAVKLGIEGSVIIEKQFGQYLDIRTDYHGIGKIQYILAQHKVHVIDSQYTDVVVVSTMIQEVLVEQIHDLIIEGTNGKSEITKGDKLWFAIVDGQFMTF